MKSKPNAPYFYVGLTRKDENANDNALRASQWQDSLKYAFGTSEHFHNNQGPDSVSCISYNHDEIYGVNFLLIQLQSVSFDGLTKLKMC